MLMLFMETVVFQNTRINYMYFSIRCFISRLSSNRELYIFLQYVLIFFHFSDIIKPIFTSLQHQNKFQDLHISIWSIKFIEYCLVTVMM